MKNLTLSRGAVLRMNNPLNHPLLQMVSIFRNGGNPLGYLQNMAAKNPYAAQAMKMIQGKSPEQLQQMAVNMARERGTNVDDIAQSLGLNLKK